MSRASVVPFRPAHADLMEIREFEREILAQRAETLVAIAEQGYCGTMMYDGRALGIIGAVKMWKGVFEIFIIPTVYVEKYPLAFVRTVKGLLDSFQESHDVVRFQTESLADELHDRWMKYIGFKCEGTLEKFSSTGLDCRMWARIYHGI